MKGKPAKTSGRAPRKLNLTAEPRLAARQINQLRELPAVKFRRILAATDFSELSMEGVEYAICLADKARAAVALVHVVEPSVSLGGMESVILAGSDDEVIKLEKRRLAMLAKKLAKEGRAVTPFTRYGKAFQEIVALAREREYDLIVTTTHGYTGLKRALIGSTAEWVVRHAPCPVLTVPARITDRKSGRSWASGIRKIVVPIDFSAISTHALPYAAALATTFKAEVTLMHVTDTPSRLGDFDGRPSPGVEAGVRQSAEERLLRIQREAFGDGICTEVVVRSGTPFDEIAKAAKRMDADLIVLTTHGHTGFKHVLLGSTAERIVRHASCPVLVVREKQV